MPQCWFISAQTLLQETDGQKQDRHSQIPAINPENQVLPNPHRGRQLSQVLGEKTGQVLMQ